MYSEGLSSAQFLPNGNVLILSGRQGYAFELTPDNEIVWEYVTPLKGGQPVPQGTLLAANDNLTFRMDRYPADFSGFEGRDLSPIGWIELNPDSQFCGNILPSFEAVRDVAVTLSPNPARDRVTISWKAGIWADLSVYDLFGRPVYGPEKLTGGQTYLDVSAWQPGTYFVRVDGGAPKVLLLQR
jgi:hypothetical protein